jgi:hypothetical protein
LERKLFSVAPVSHINLQPCLSFADHRAKIELEVREDEAKRATIENNNLKEEQRRLENLLALAKKTVQAHEEQEQSTLAQMLYPGSHAGYSSPSMMWMSGMQSLADMDRKKPAITTAAVAPQVLQHPNVTGLRDLGQVASSCMTETGTAGPSTARYPHFMNDFSTNRADTTLRHPSAAGPASAALSRLAADFRGDRTDIQGTQDPLASLFATSAPSSYPYQHHGQTGLQYAATSQPLPRAPADNVNILQQLLGILQTRPPAPAMPPSPPSTVAASGRGGEMTASEWPDLELLFAANPSNQTIARLLSSLPQTASNAIPRVNSFLLDSQVKTVCAANEARGDVARGSGLSSSLSANDLGNVLKPSLLPGGHSPSSSPAEENANDGSTKEPTSSHK